MRYYSDERPSLALRFAEWTVGLLCLAAFAATALADGPMPEVDPSSAGETLLSGISAGAWVAIVAGGGLLVVWLLRLLLLAHLRGKALAITSTILIGVAGTLAQVAAGIPWMEAALAGVAAGLAAGKAWDILPERAKAVAKKPIKAQR